MLNNHGNGLQGFFAELSWASASRLYTANITTINQALQIHSILALIIGPVTTLTFHPRKQPAIHHNKMEFLIEKSPYSLAFWPPDTSGSSLTRSSLKTQNQPLDWQQVKKRQLGFGGTGESLTKNHIYELLENCLGLFQCSFYVVFRVRRVSILEFRVVRVPRVLLVVHHDPDCKEYCTSRYLHVQVT